ncbi:hypothetical protein OF83DRAFT_1080178 [Amylostereum chailletii]|nr:hypothetical protein OF83DRAFT_1080178 [Amylostereum chailletii]
MKFSSAFVAFVTLAGTLVSGLPLRMRQETVALQASFTSGSIYFLSNEPSGNYVVSADIGSDGRLAISRAVATNGRGSHGLSETDGPDAVYSQGVIRASVAAGLVATVNPGSNSVSLFKVDPTTPSLLTEFGMPISSGGEFPVSVAFNDAGDMLCVLNAGAMDGVQCFTMDADLGLVSMPNTRRPIGMGQTTPPAGPLRTASQVVFSEDQQSLIVAVKGNPDQNVAGYLASWDISPSGLSKDFTRIELPAGAGAPFSLTAIPGKNAWLSADPVVGVDIFDFSNGPAGVAASNKTATVPIQPSNATCWSAYSPKMDRYYITDVVTDLVTEVSVDDNLAGSVVNQYPMGNNSATLDLQVASVGDKDFLYVLMPNVTAVQVMSVDGPGQLSSLQTMDISGPAAAINLPINASNLIGMSVYVKPQ